MRTKIYITLLLLMIAWGCKKAYNPKISGSSPTGYLVVDGVIGTGQDSTVIRLSRTVPLSSVQRSKPELGATVTVLTDGGSSFLLTETGNGYYSTPGLNLTSPGKYGLKIVTSNGKVYQSDLIPATNSPAIDSVYYKIKNNGVQIYADTHDPGNSSRYYRWDFTETYEIHSQFDSHEYYTHVPFDTVLPRPIQNQIYTCWVSAGSPNILLNSSAKLSRDIITGNPITFMPLTSLKVANRYTILVKQYALTSDAFNYFQQLKKNSEQLGSIFDAQPSELPGNIHCVSNPAEHVLGYITAGSTSESRIFIDRRNLPASPTDNPYAGCMLDTLLYQRAVGAALVNEVQEYIYTRFQDPVDPISKPGSPTILGYTASSPECVDCTLRGTNVKPSFWVDE
ncbi:MAG TPA: DUF4249 domain-containing protein [Mucilaginibacter sp.]|nr:DUF4249 domain-containing protein [Mucilaginibacter sp.]